MNYPSNTKNYRYPLSDEQRQSAEGAISLQECTKVLNSFPLNRAPGNDGLTVEFYKIFWDSIAQILVECFNESFAKGEMSSKAVIRLIEKRTRIAVILKTGGQFHF